MAEAGGDIVFRDVRVFDGRSDTLSGPSDVVVSGNLIRSIAPTAADSGTDPTTRVLDGGGRVLMPGLIDAHTHIAFGTVPLAAVTLAAPEYIAVRGGVAAGEMLQRGFTSARDCGGPTFGIKQAIDEGLVAGPRIWPSGAMISQTSGHGDFRAPYETPRGSCGWLSHSELVGATAIADGTTEVLRATREQLRGGASQIKLMAGGGVASPYDPIDVTEYTEPELRAAVDAAANWGTYVLVHAYTPRSVRQALHAGVRCVDHGHLLDEETVALIAEKDAWWSLQPFLDDEDAIPIPSPAGRAKQLAVVHGTDIAYELAQRYQVRLAWGTDTLFDAKLATRQGAQLAKMTRWFTPAQVLRMATSANAELLAMSGPRNPYPGTLGVVAEGALADLLLVDGNPLDRLDLLATPETSLVASMKDGVLYKNLL
ncbi:metal-dependent hydrolase family protein [Actinocatenispora rupis]|uniref:Hydrolase n=1 Tax=Actinocatenispora rupis TaxID=519421 RepID=A0A8J3N8D8_9ACTN|nr:amidohydrolase family protein [Actinocatenispora rupis]GID09981.1 hydrolase [Actinocatenispora rupis]